MDCVHPEDTAVFGGPAMPPAVRGVAQYTHRELGPRLPDGSSHFHIVHAGNEHNVIFLGR